MIKFQKVLQVVAKAEKLGSSWRGLQKSLLSLLLLSLALKMRRAIIGAFRSLPYRFSLYSIRKEAQGLKMGVPKGANIIEH